MATTAASAAMLAAGSGTLAQSPAPAARPANAPFGYCLNTSTVRGAKLGIDAVVDIAARAGFNGIEPWISELEEFEKKGGSLKDLGKKLADNGIAVPSAIGFAKWIVNDDAERAKGLEQMKRDMDKVAAIGGTHIAAPAVGATKPEDPAIDLLAAGARYREVCNIGDQAGVIPEVEVWGFSKTLTRLADAMMVAIASGHPKACVLADVYHLYKGGSDAAGLRLINGATMSCIHFNDYPADPPRETITDAHRIFPGDGVAPIKQILTTLRDTGFRGYLSLELFNRDYWKQAPPKVAEAGIAKMKEAVAKAFG
ncbi:sugar phosphate isomerase/epimerase family protein [Humisphaera borealis]|uniref:Sugar phosphate isomerase/epimerase n=1 Tax=Humisphaera borealis TaxID=2807512 RepID=A0A7M2WYY0_9BACT|nr:sugar phosphate isomerase/epimerase [Humisphaera borealis]